MEEQTLRKMVEIYCKSHHGANLCKDCEALFQYGLERAGRCPRKQVKTFCATCPNPCYRPEMRARMKAVMAYSGPRMMVYAPKLAIAHLWDQLRHKVG